MGTFPKVPPLALRKGDSPSFFELRTERDSPHARGSTLGNVPLLLIVF